MSVHWDEVEPRELRAGDIGGLWQALGDAAGAVGVGVNRVRVAPGDRTTPVHTHGASEEIFYVLGGSALLWQDEETCRVGPGDCIVHLPYANDHTLIAGDDGLEVLIYGTRGRAEFGALERAGVLRFGGDAVAILEGPSPWEREPPLDPPEPGDRPANVVALADAEAAYGGIVRRLGKSAGARRTGLNHVTLPPGGTGASAHCHSAEEEVFVALDGDATLLLYPRGSRGGDPEEHPIRPGHVVARPPGTGVAHAFRAGPGGFTYLAYGTREPDDTTYYPESQKVALRGLGVSFTLPSS
ncbi:MAG TPA: cupin domain-containing protein [Gaiellaceae bacterium]|nr:cupin domain-containing protein [Gaiellaceae bacterium]